MNAMYKLELTDKNRSVYYDILRHNLEVYNNLNNKIKETQRVLINGLRKYNSYTVCRGAEPYSLGLSIIQISYEETQPAVKSITNYLSALSNNDIKYISIKEDEYNNFNMKVDDNLESWDIYTRCKGYIKMYEED